MTHDHEDKYGNHMEMSRETYEHHKKGVYSTTIILSIVTIVEVVFALFYDAYLVPKGWPKNLLRVILVIMSLFKAYLIMAIFMHLKYERKAFVMTIVVPFIFLVYMAWVFMYEGLSWNEMNKARFPDKFAKEVTAQPAHSAHE